MGNPLDFAVNLKLLLKIAYFVLKSLCILVLLFL